MHGVCIRAQWWPMPPAAFRVSISPYHRAARCSDAKYKMIAWRRHAVVKDHFSAGAEKQPVMLKWGGRVWPCGLPPTTADNAIEQ